MSKGFTSSPRIALLAGVILLSFTGISVQLVKLHVLDRDELMKFVVKARSQTLAERARRGDILDARGNVLATSRPQVTLVADPQVLNKDDEAKWPRLAELLGVPLSELREKLTTKTRKRQRPKPAGEGAAAASGAAGIALTLSGEKAAEAAPPAQPPLSAAPAFSFTLSLLSENQAPAVAAAGGVGGDEDVETGAPDDDMVLIRWRKLGDEIDEATYDKIMALKIEGVFKDDGDGYSYRRVYPHNGMAAHVIGYVNKIGMPVTGLEAYADFYLHGRDGWREGERDGRRQELAQFRTRDVPASHGYNVMLSIDANVQSIIEDEIAAIVTRFQPHKATIIVSNARTGFILGLANYPSYNLNEYNKPGADGKADIAAQRNIAVTDEYEPGSVFKIVAAAGALEEGLVTPLNTFDCSIDRIEYNGLLRRLPREDHVFDHRLSVPEIIARSSNRGAVQLAMKLGDQKFYNYVRAFGFGERTGFPAGGEIATRVKTPKEWDSLTVTRMPMGQSVSVTVLQMHQAMGVIASGGLLLRPQLVTQISDPAGEVVLRYDRVEARRVISEKTARTMATMLMGVASSQGTAPEAAIPRFQVAGKTGTTQKLIDGHYSETHHVASFVGFFPASRPEVVISVIVDDADAHAPGGIAYGAKVAAPSFKHIGEQLIQLPYLPYLNIKPVFEPSRDLLVMEGGRQ